MEDLEIQTARGEQRLRDVLGAATQQLAQAEVDDPRLVAEVLLAHVSGVSRTHLLAHLNQPISHLVAASETTSPRHLGYHRPVDVSYYSLVDRCASGEPLAYLVGHREFYDLDFTCDPRALIPRPETELLVETILNRRGQRAGGRLVDVGTGSGCIAVTLAAHWPGAHVYAVDISPEALALARHNAERYGVSERVTFLHGDLLDPLAEPVHVIAANLPYVTTSEWEALPDHIRQHEPRVALNGGADGLDLVRRLLAQAPTHLLPSGIVVLEIGAAQGEPVAQLARAAFPQARVEVKQDYAGLDRLIVIETSLPDRF